MNKTAIFRGSVRWNCSYCSRVNVEFFDTTVDTDVACDECGYVLGTPKVAFHCNNSHTMTVEFRCSLPEGHEGLHKESTHDSNGDETWKEWL